MYDRSQVRRKRDKKEIGISAVRGGTIVGIHDVIFAGTDEVIELPIRHIPGAYLRKGQLKPENSWRGKRPGCIIWEML